MLLAVDTRDRSSGSASAFQVNMPFSKPISSIELVQFTCLNTLKNLQGVQSLSLSDDNGDFTITITPNQYTSLALTTELQTLLNASSSHYTVIYNSTTHKFAITNSSFDFTFTFTNNNLAQALGFFVGSYTSASQLLVSRAYVSTTINPFTRFFIQISNASPNLTGVGVPFSFSINNTVAYGSLIEYDSYFINPSIQRISFSPISLINLQVRVIDHYGNLLDLQNSDWNMLLKIS